MKSESCKIKMTTQTRGRDCQFFEKDLFGMSIYKKRKRSRWARNSERVNNDNSKKRPTSSDTWGLVYKDNDWVTHWLPPLKCCHRKKGKETGGRSPSRSPDLPSDMADMYRHHYHPEHNTCPSDSRFLIRTYHQFDLKVQIYVDDLFQCVFVRNNIVWGLSISRSIK